MNGLNNDTLEVLLLTCDYKSILRIYQTCKSIHKLGIKNLLIKKSKNQLCNNTYFIPGKIVKPESREINIRDKIKVINYLLDQNIDFKDQDTILLSEFDQVLNIVNKIFDEVKDKTDDIDKISNSINEVIDKLKHNPNFINDMLRDITNFHEPTYHIFLEMLIFKVGEK